MFLGAYRFAGDPADLLPAYERLMAGMLADARCGGPVSLPKTG